uniref:Uncharacterized protein n=1 Tax=Photinus pyralis TaxID=7054 RepID=A0A1Y1MSN7_PHOPY
MGHHLAVETFKNNAKLEKVYAKIWVEPLILNFGPIGGVATAPTEPITALNYLGIMCYGPLPPIYHPFAPACSVCSVRSVQSANSFADLLNNYKDVTTPRVVNDKVPHSVTCVPSNPSFRTSRIPSLQPLSD